MAAFRHRTDHNTRASLTNTDKALGNCQDDKAYVLRGTTALLRLNADQLPKRGLGPLSVSICDELPEYLKGLVKSFAEGVCEGLSPLTQSHGLGSLRAVREGLPASSQSLLYRGLCQGDYVITPLHARSEQPNCTHTTPQDASHIVKVATFEHTRL